MLNMNDLIRRFPSPDSCEMICIKAQFPISYEPDAIKAVVEQLAAQGMIAVTRLASGNTVLVLQIGEISDTRVQ